MLAHSRNPAESQQDHWQVGFDRQGRRSDRRLHENPDRRLPGPSLGLASPDGWRVSFATPYATIPLRTAYRIRSAVPCRFSFSMIFLRCVSTVKTLRNRRPATSLLL